MILVKALVSVIHITNIINYDEDYQSHHDIAHKQLVIGQVFLLHSENGIKKDEDFYWYNDENVGSVSVDLPVVGVDVAFILELHLLIVILLFIRVKYKEAYYLVLEKYSNEQHGDHQYHMQVELLVVLIRDLFQSQLIVDVGNERSMDAVPLYFGR